MSKEQLDAVITQFGQSWAALNPNSVMSLIAREDLQYFESTFELPTSAWAAVNELWQIVPNNQKDVSWWHEILLHNGNQALAHVKVTRTLLPSGEKQNIDAAFLFGINNKGEINYFRQWRMLQ